MKKNVKRSETKRPAIEGDKLGDIAEIVVAETVDPYWDWGPEKDDIENQESWGD